MKDQSTQDPSRANTEQAAFLSYTYCLLRYTHDSTAGEALNVGVILYSDKVPVLLADFPTEYKRLSDAFADFDGRQYTRTMKRFVSGVVRWNEQISPETLSLQAPPASLTSVMETLWPDQGLAYRFSEPRVGICPASSNPRTQLACLREELSDLLERYVTSQYDNYRRPKRSDTEVWAAYVGALRTLQVTPQLTEKTFTVSGFEYKFDHTFKNGSYHVLQPVSLDYADKNGIKERVAKLHGDANLLKEEGEIGMVYLLLGKPSDPDKMETYQNAVRLLDKMPLPHQIVEEEQAEEFAQTVADKMKKLGLLPEKTFRDELNEVAKQVESRRDRKQA